MNPLTDVRIGGLLPMVVAVARLKKPTRTAKETRELARDLNEREAERRREADEAYQEQLEKLKPAARAAVRAPLNVLDVYRERNRNQRP